MYFFSLNIVFFIYILIWHDFSSVILCFNITFVESSFTSGQQRQKRCRNVHFSPWWKDFSFIINMCLKKKLLQPWIKVWNQTPSPWSNHWLSVSSHTFRESDQTFTLIFTRSTMHFNWSHTGIPGCCVTMRLDCCEALGLCIVSGLSEKFALLNTRRCCGSILGSLSWRRT